MTYGEKIASLRKQNNMTQSELGEKLNVSFQAVSKWEKGLSEPDLDTIRKLCEIFKVSTDEFFGLPETKTEQKEQPVTIIKEKVIEKPVTVLGYCEDCKKPLYSPEDYIVHKSGGGRGHSATQHVYCKECDEKRKAARAAAEREEFLRRRKNGFIWGGVVGAALSILFIVAGLLVRNTIKEYYLVMIVGGLGGAYGGFAFTSQMIWQENSLADCFSFFLHSFRLPMIIFTLDLEGIFFLITVKLLGSIICGLLSFILFVIGLVVTTLFAMIIFPFNVIKECKKV